jgi:hypothetical protein
MITVFCSFFSESKKKPVQPLKKQDGKKKNKETTKEKKNEKSAKKTATPIGLPPPPTPPSTPSRKSVAPPHVLNSVIPSTNCPIKKKKKPNAKKSSVASYLTEMLQDIIKTELEKNMIK